MTWYSWKRAVQVSMRSCGSAIVCDQTAQQLQLRRESDSMLSSQ
jgi:hypothetical protein